MKWPPDDRRALPTLAGTVAFAVWLGGTLLGKHVDSGLIGFSATMFAIAGSAGNNDKRQERRRRRKPSPPHRPPSSSHHPPTKRRGESETE